MCSPKLFSCVQATCKILKLHALACCKYSKCVHAFVCRVHVCSVCMYVCVCICACLCSMHIHNNYVCKCLCIVSVLCDVNMLLFTAQVIKDTCPHSSQLL